MIATPAVSVLIPVYNGARWIDDCLQSLFAQTFTDFEVVIVDDGSSDQTSTVVRGFLGRSTPVQFYELPKNRGIVGALNFGLKKCRGDLIARIDADDIACPERLEKQVRLLHDRPDVDLVGGQVETIDQHGVVCGRSPSPISIGEAVRVLRFCTPVPHPLWMTRRSTYDRLSGYREVAPAEDYDFLLRLHCAGGRFLNHPDTLLRMRIHNANTHSVQGLRQLRAKRFVYRNVTRGEHFELETFRDQCFVDPRDQRRYSSARTLLAMAVVSRSRWQRLIIAMRAALSHREIARYLFERAMYRLLIREFV